MLKHVCLFSVINSHPRNPGVKKIYFKMQKVCKTEGKIPFFLLFPYPFVNFMIKKRKEVWKEGNMTICICKKIYKTNVLEGLSDVPWREPRHIIRKILEHTYLYLLFLKASV